MTDSATFFGRIRRPLRTLLSMALLPLQLVVVMHLLLAAAGLAVWKMLSLQRAVAREMPVVPHPSRVASRVTTGSRR